MTEIAYTATYVTQVELGRAYQQLGHSSSTRPWSATLLIGHELTMSWACRVLDRNASEEDGTTRHTWHVIAEAGELDWPPLRPEPEIWPALLEREPVPTGERAEREAQLLGTSVEAMHRDRLRQHYLGPAHLSGLKRNATDVNFSPLVRDWAATARELASFIDSHRPPRLTVEQRVMEQGVRLAQLEAAAENAKASLARLLRNANHAQGEQPRHGFKSDLMRWAGKSRPTVDAWLAEDSSSDSRPEQNDQTA
ncbi:hypothetical protein [Streptomyces albidoflavus]|uniref:hypothetical protein n=1 Tax=Streptomyces albidoflavus TaxID=1886 RepID=UPI00101EC478|nr:hypothetical protein [Streptomyces albidoflavus]RZF02889.1 hypothetical protein C0R05_32270 [Streptomyces albidoflavus]